MPSIEYSGEVEFYVICSKCGADLGAEVKTTRFGIEVKTEPCQGCIDDAVDKEATNG